MEGRRAARSPLDRVGRLLSWLGLHELGTLALLLALALTSWAFLELADEMGEGELREVDERLLLALRSADDPSDPVGPPWFEELVRDFTAFGGMGPLALLTFAAIGYLLLRRKRGTALLVLVSMTGGILTSLLLKDFYDRPRPDLVPHGSHVLTQSFPSGHSMLSAVAYLTLGAILARVQPSARLKAYVLLLAIAVTGLVGASRVYLGVHWPTDVLAGWTAGAIWALAVWSVTRRLQRRGQIEPEPPQEEEREEVELAEAG